MKNLILGILVLCGSAAAYYFWQVDGIVCILTGIVGVALIGTGAGWDWEEDENDGD